MGQRAFDEQQGNRSVERCDACGQTSGAGFRFCPQCGVQAKRGPMGVVPSRALSDDVDAIWERLVLEASCSQAELSWEALAQGDVTAVWRRGEDTQTSPMPSDTTVVTEGFDPMQASIDTVTARRFAESFAPPARTGDTVVALHPSPPAPWSPPAGQTEVCAQLWPLVSEADGVHVVDPEAFGSVWVRLEAPVWLLDGDHFRIGGQLVRFELDAQGYGRLRVVVDGRLIGPAVRIEPHGTVLGRGAVEIAFDDPRLEVAHARVRAVDEGVILEDLGGVDGTWLQVRAGDVVPHGSLAMLGDTLVCLEPAQAQG